MYPSLFKIAGLKQGSIHEHISLDGTSWCFHFKRILKESEVNQLAAMLVSIGHSPPPLSSQRDSRVWTPSSTGSFTVKSTYKSLVENAQDVSVTNFPYKAIWNPHVPPKICFFYWTATHNKIATQDSLQHRNFKLASRCPLCPVECESTEHLLLNCHFSRKVWSLILPRTRWWIPPLTVLQLAQTWSSKGILGPAKEIWDLVPAVVIWALWNERNRRIFEDKSLSHFHVSVEVKASILAWSSVFNRNFNFRLDWCVFSWESMFH
ncbi:uncharacterized protein LOC113300647 [Papaver somniferum]|uniref:uncharacterized protein LOC113300647 n=1 Tax=Papaver somniferum TaxID=3469 RepID=UPI000E6FEBAE|nr:uncharacterized protein LOC113300647 [Papaver somniferum]